MISNTPIQIRVQDIIGQQMQAYAFLMLVLSSALLLYVLWNNFVRSPSNKKSFKEVIEGNFNPDNMINNLGADEGIEPSIRVKKISRALDEYIIIPALVMFYITLSYYFAIRG